MLKQGLPRKQSVPNPVTPRPEMPRRLKVPGNGPQLSRLEAAGRSGKGRRRTAALAVAAALLLLIGGGLFAKFQFFTPAQAFALPTNLTWSGYVLHYTENRVDTQGQTYQVEVYHDIGGNQIHVEATMEGQFDVVVVSTPQTIIGKDMLHHVAQYGSSVSSWLVDGPLFNLSTLRQNLANHTDTYLGTSIYNGRSVYQIKVSDGNVLLLSMQYLPINVLSSSSSSANSLYTSFSVVRFSTVPDYTWDTQVPSGFQMGQIPASS
jgi:hypothetical protein